MREKIKILARHVLAFSILLMLTNCEEENSFIGKEEDQKAKSVQESRSWFETDSEQKRPEIFKYIKTLQWDDAIFSKGNKGEIVEVPFIVNDNITFSMNEVKTRNEFHRLMIIKDKEGSYKTFHVLIRPKEIGFDNLDRTFNFYNVNFDGVVYVYDATEKITTFKNFKSNLAKLDLVSKIKEYEKYTCVYFGYWYEDGHFEPLSVIGCSDGGGGTGYQGGPTNGSSGTGAGTVQTNVYTKTPCDKIRKQIMNATFKSKLSDLSTKTGLEKESGYSQNRSGVFTTLTANGANELNMPNDATRIGFMHTHIDPYDSGKRGPNGEIIYNVPIKMFSPADISSFLIMVNNAQTYNSPISDVYGMMVSSEGTYQLSFTGNVADIKSKYGTIDWINLDEDYKTYTKNDVVGGFLNFLKDKIGINGIELYQVDANGGGGRIMLGSDGEPVGINCNGLID
jgi:hypothetical protein